MKRFDLVDVRRFGEAWREMVEREDGDWVFYCDVVQDLDEARRLAEKWRAFSALVCHDAGIGYFKMPFGLDDPDFPWEKK